MMLQSNSPQIYKWLKTYKQGKDNCLVFMVAKDHQVPWRPVLGSALWHTHQWSGKVGNNEVTVFAYVTKLFRIMKSNTDSEKLWRIFQDWVTDSEREDEIQCKYM